MKIFSILILVISLWAAAAQAASFGNAVEVRIMTDEGRNLPIYPVSEIGKTRKVYAEAVKGDNYRIEVRNLLNRKVGLVIAVDGRNIISGTKSWLKNSERMYILEPYGSGSFGGWRTAQDRINRFYFTEVPDSYAAAFGDESAMGVIAVAVYPEIVRADCLSVQPRNSPSVVGRESGGGVKDDKREALPATPGGAKGILEKKKAASSERSLESAGTGYGRDEYSYVRIVSFDPEKTPVETHYIKYEWRSTLCRLGIIPSTQYREQKPNRFWDHDGYTPPPPVSFRR